MILRTTKRSRAWCSRGVLPYHSSCIFLVFAVVFFCGLRGDKDCRTLFVYSVPRMVLCPGCSSACRILFASPGQLDLQVHSDSQQVDMHWLHGLQPHLQRMHLLHSQATLLLANFSDGPQSPNHPSSPRMTLADEQCLQSSRHVLESFHTRVTQEKNVHSLHVESQMLACKGHINRLVFLVLQ